MLRDRDIHSSNQASTAITLRASTPPPDAVPEDPHSGGVASATLEVHVESPAIAIVDSTSNNADAFRPSDDSEEQKKGPEKSTAEQESSASVPPTMTPRATAGGPPQVDIRDGISHDGVQVHDESHEGSVPGAALDKAEAGEPTNPVAESHNVNEEDDGDPHEISEGVYIEPPPPVLMELPSSLDQPACTLFNAPVDAPSDEAEVNASSIGTSYIVLLQNRPTLYYETLNDVFDALREEERIQSITEFVDGEMIIEAYDLQLVVSEVIFAFLVFDFALTSHENQDNVHAREISLHDLNVLHHGLGLTGPLRLRVRTVLSRFINRYRSLQAQTMQLNVSKTASVTVENPNEDERVYVGPRESL
jgi:hypothetical protein